MTAPWTAVVLTLFPEMFPGPLGVSLAGRALLADRWRLQAENIRTHAPDRHGTVDDTPCGGGAGMVMRPDVIDAAVRTHHVPGRRLLYLTPRGRLLDQALVRDLAAAPGITVLCGRYEGVDHRVVEEHAMEEVSLGDFVLSGGEPAALVLIDACVRLLPGVMGSAASLEEESFERGLLEYPHYTRPTVWRDRAVPEVLLSGHHARIDAWRRARAEDITRQRRPDLWRRHVARNGLKEDVD